MQLGWVILIAVAAAIACLAQADVEASVSKKIPAYVSSWDKLNRGPPIPPAKTRAAVVTDWITQKLDHFDASEKRTWQMRYMTNSEHYQPGGPIFIYVGGEWEISEGSIKGGYYYDLCKEHKCMLIYTEHRYYGKSRPTSLITVNDLKYLNVRQALADLAHFVRTTRASNPSLANSKVIMAGGSYAATMVVWFKRVYPELLNGGWASSAPLLAKVDFKEYKEVVGRALRELGSDQCYRRVENGIAELEWMIENKRAAEVKALLKICNNFDERDQMNVYTLFSSISNIFAGIVQYQQPGDIPTYCDFLMSFEDDLSAITNFVLWAYGYPQGCLDMTYQGIMNYYNVPTYDYGASRPWFFQTCNEYGWYQTSASRAQPFGKYFPVSYNTRMCYDVFRQQYTAENININAAETNNYFGGMHPDVENIYMTQGGLDPWNPMGHGVAEGATVITHASHCADFGSISNYDSAEMRASKQKLAKLVRQWLA